MNKSSTAKKKRILVMDDEKIIRNAATKLMTRLGYEIEVANNGAETIEKYKKALSSGNPFDVVIIDLTIPGGVGGEETIHTLLKINPHIKAIVSSGYTEDPVITEYKKYGFKGMIKKPFNLIELKMVLKNLLED